MVVDGWEVREGDKRREEGEGKIVGVDKGVVMSGG